MAKYLLIESRDPYTSGEVTTNYDLAANLVQEGNDVTLFLVQNGVFPVRRGALSTNLGGAMKAGVEILADDFSLRERGISADRLIDGVKAVPLDVVIDHLVEGHKAIWN